MLLKSNWALKISHLTCITTQSQMINYISVKMHFAFHCRDASSYSWYAFILFLVSVCAFFLNFFFLFLLFLSVFFTILLFFMISVNRWNVMWCIFSIYLCCEWHMTIYCYIFGWMLLFCCYWYSDENTLHLWFRIYCKMVRL